MEMKKKNLSITGLGLLALLLAACSNDDNTNTQTVEIGTKTAITLNMEDFGADQNITRATQTAKNETVDLGDGLTAEVSLTADAKEEQTPATRATRATMTDAHYTIYALDAGGNRIAGKELKGTVSGNTFVKDAGSHMTLAPGTYTFVCFNDAVTDNGTSLSITNGKNALIGTTTATISGPEYQINFQMKHQTARVRLKITSYTAEGTGIAATLSSTTNQPQTNTYDVKATTITTTNAAVSADYTVPVSGQAWSPYVTAFNNTTDYDYFLPGTTGTAMKVTFTGGTLHGGSLAGKALASLPNLGTLARNGSYTVNVKLKRKAHLYLYQDGTVGYIEDKSTRTPIGVVLTEKTTTERGLAIALKDDDVTYYMGWSPFKTYTTIDYANINDGLSDMNGEYTTWDPAANKRGGVAAGDDTGSGYYYAAGHYDPGVTVTGANVGKWFLGSAGQWRLVYALGGGNPADIHSISYSNNSFPWDDNLADQAFIAAGGNALRKTRSYAASTEIRPQFIMVLYRKTNALGWDTASGHQAGARAFVHF